MSPSEGARAAARRIAARVLYELVEQLPEPLATQFREQLRLAGVKP